MNLVDLTADEQVALVALVRKTLLADRSVSESEQDSLADLIAKMGASAYRAAVEAADLRLTNDDELRQHVLAVSRQDARELIYAEVLDLALSDGIGAGQPPLLRWLRSSWNIDVEIPPDNPEAGGPGRW